MDNKIIEDLTCRIVDPLSGTEFHIKPDDRGIVVNIVPPNTINSVLVRDWTAAGRNQFIETLQRFEFNTNTNEMVLDTVDSIYLVTQEYLTFFKKMV